MYRWDRYSSNISYSASISHLLNNGSAYSNLERWRLPEPKKETADSIVTRSSHKRSLKEEEKVDSNKKKNHKGQKDEEKQSDADERVEKNGLSASEETEEDEDEDDSKQADAFMVLKSNTLRVRMKRKSPCLADAALPILDMLCTHSDCFPFVQPVDSVKLRIPEYLEIIKFPLSLSDVRSRVMTNYYASFEDFALDIRHIFDNAWTYNSRFSDVFSMASRLWAAAFDALLHAPPFFVRQLTDTFLNLGNRKILRCMYIFSCHLKNPKRLKTTKLPHKLRRRLGRRAGQVPHDWPKEWLRYASRCCCIKSS